jgi:hypothetical protein
VGPPRGAGDLHSHLFDEKTLYYQSFKRVTRCHSQVAGVARAPTCCVAIRYVQSDISLSNRIPKALFMRERHASHLPKDALAETMSYVLHAAPRICKRRPCRHRALRRRVFERALGAKIFPESFVIALGSRLFSVSRRAEPEF